MKIEKGGQSRIRIFLVVALVLLSSASVLAGSYNESENESILNCLDNIDSIIANFHEEGFNVLRLEDLRLMVKESYDSGLAFDSIMTKCDSAEKIKKMAFDSRDFIGALKLFYDETDKSGVNMSLVDIKIEEIDNEFDNERYEKIEDLVNAAYDEIIEVQSTSSSLKIFYSSSRGRIVSFFEDHYRGLLVFIGFFLIMYFIFKNRIKIWIRLMKIRDRELRKDVIKDLIRKTQKEYFSRGSISRGMYSVRIKKFSEIIRDLDKEILGFNEELLKIRSKRK